MIKPYFILGMGYFCETGFCFQANNVPMHLDFHFGTYILLNALQDLSCKEGRDLENK